MALDYVSTSRPTQLAAALTNVATSVLIVDGTTYPDPAVNGKQYTVIIGYGSDREEVCTVTAKPTATTLTVLRGQDGTPATAKNVGDTVVHGVSARDFKRIDAAEADVDVLESGKVSKAGDTMTGPLVLPGNAAAALQAVPLQQLSAAVPIGVITAFGGAVAPTGWHLCDGSAHGSTALQALTGSTTTPDLRGLFVVGAGTNGDPTTGATTNYAAGVGTKSGKESVTLSATQSGVAAHGHPGSTADAVAAHQHTFTTGAMSANNVHSHSVTGATDTQGAGYRLNIMLEGSDSANNNVWYGTQSPHDNGAAAHAHNVSGTAAGVDINHSHSGTADAGGAHSHTLTVANAAATAAAAAHENRPPYYALTYIIKKA